MAKGFNCMTADENRDDLGANGTPDMIDAVDPAYLLGIVYRSGRVTIGYHIDM